MYPHVLISNDRMVLSSAWDAFCEEHNTNHRRTNPGGSPTENALRKRMSITIGTKNNPNEWLAHLQTVVNNANGQITGGMHRTATE